jgi:hypothetical protein
MALRYATNLADLEDWQTQQRHRSEEFRRFLGTIEANLPADLDVHLIPGQLRNPQNGADSQLASQETALSLAFHADFRQLAPSGRAMVCRAHREAIAPRLTPLD